MIYSFYKTKLIEGASMQGIKNEVIIGKNYIYGNNFNNKCYGSFILFIEWLIAFDPLKQAYDKRDPERVKYIYDEPGTNNRANHGEIGELKIFNEDFWELAFSSGKILLFPRGGFMVLFEKSPELKQLAGAVNQLLAHGVKVSYKEIIPV